MEQTVPSQTGSSKKSLTIILVLILFAAVAGLFFIVNYQKQNITKSPADSGKTVNAEARLSFIPNTLYATKNQKIASDIVFDAGDTAIQSLTISVSYDSSKIKNVKVTPYKDPNSALSYSLVALPVVETNSAQGLTEVTYKLLSEGSAQKGRGIVAKFEGILVSAPTNVNFGQGSRSVSSDSNTNLSIGMVNLNIFPDSN